jgi:sugar lactone lactonase YvrE
MSKVAGRVVRGRPISGIWAVGIGLFATMSSMAPGQAQAQAQPPVSTIALGPGCTRPESVIKGFGGKYFVSCQNAGTVGLDDGKIFTFDLGGNVSEFAGGGKLDNPRGLAFTGQYLVVTDTTKVKKIDSAGNVTTIVEASQFPNLAEFFNDAVAEPGGRAVYVTEMGARTQIRIGAVPPAPNVLAPTDSAQAWAVPAISRVYRVALDGRITEVVTPSRKNLIINGVAFGNFFDVLLTDFFYGNVVRVWPGGIKEIVATGFRGADGIEQAKNGSIYVSSFENGAVWKMDARGENVDALIDGVGFQSTADLYLDEAQQLVLVADTLHSTVIVLPM